MKKIFLLAYLTVGGTVVLASPPTPIFEVKEKIKQILQIEKKTQSTKEKDLSLACCHVTITTEGGHKGEGQACAPSQEEACDKAMDKAMKEAFGK